MRKRFHLTGFMLFAPAPHMIMSWIYPREKIRAQWWEPEYWAEIARTLQRGAFSMFFFADGWAGGTNRLGVRYAIQFPNHDPVSLLPYLAAVTDRLGLAVTMSTTFYAPYMLARKLSTLDHLSKGRVGWNIVSSIARAEARNFGLDELPPHDERYDRADEFMEVCYRLWDSWDDDALLMDMERGIFADPDKLHRLDFEGEWYRCQGPLNVIPSPQRRPFLFQAGQSERGRAFAARHAECVFATGASAEGMRAFCEDLDSRAECHGRRRGAVRVLWLAQPLVAASESEALERYEEIRERIPLEASLSLMSGHFNYDLSKLDLDKPVGDLQVPGTQGALDVYVQNKPDITLREIASTYLSGSADSPMVGTPKQVADHMIHLIEDGGGHGFQITPAYYAPDYYADLVRLLIPELQARGVYWRDYEGATLRDYMDAL